MADILIRGMELPETCGFCKLCLDDSRICNGYCMLFHCRVNMMERDKDCPLVPLPEGHGRLIDADALRTRMYETMDYQDLYLPIHFEMCMGDVPTIIEAEGGTDDCYGANQFV